MRLDSFKVLSILAARGGTRDGFCREAGIQEATLRTAINGKRSPRLQTIHKIADALGVPVSDILERPGQ